MLEKKETLITYTSNANLKDYKVVCREYATPKTLMQLLEDYENVVATSKEIKVIKNSKELEINLNFKQEIELINNEIKELETQQDTLTFKAYLEKSKELANRKKATIEKYAFLKSKVVSVEYYNAIVINQLDELTQAFTTFVSREFRLIINL